MSDAFPAHLLHLSTLLLLSRSTSFTHSSSQSVSTLSHLLERYIQTLATSSLQHANQAGRTQISVWDVGRAIEEFGLPGDSVERLREEVDRGDDGIEEEAEGLRELGKSLQDHLATDIPQVPVAQLSYDPLNRRDLTLLNALQQHSFVDLADGIEEEAGSTQGGSSPSTSATSIDHPVSGANQEDEEEEQRITIKAEPGISTQDLFGSDSIDQVLAGENSDQFLESLGLGSTPNVGDVAVSIFHPFDTAGRPIDSIDILQPASFNLSSIDIEQQHQPEQYRPFSAWRDDADRPDYVPDWFPPFPGSEKESDQSIQARRRREEKERERERRAKEEGGVVSIGKSRVSTALGGQGDPWSDAVPFSSSILAESSTLFPNSLPTPSSPHRQPKQLPSTTTSGENSGERATKKRRTSSRRRSLSPPAVQPSSLPTFNSIAPLLPHAPTYLRPSQLRRSAASLISHDPHHPELQISSDSLFGLLPYVPTLRQPTLPPGFLPDFAPPLIHAFNTNLPWTVSSPVPYHPSTPTSSLSASSPHPRVPSAISQIAKNLSFPLQFDPKNREQLHPNIGLFSRLKRIGPPGPLGPKGETLNYEYVGQTALISMNVEWSQREHNMKLPKKFGAEEAGTPGAGEGIKLKLGSSTNRQAMGEGSRMGSPVNGFNVSGATPGPSGLRRSESIVPPPPTQSYVNSHDVTPGGGGGIGMELDNQFDFIGGSQGDQELDASLKLMMENLDSYPTTESRRNSLSQQQLPQFGDGTSNHESTPFDQNQFSMPIDPSLSDLGGQGGDFGQRRTPVGGGEPSSQTATATSSASSLPSLPTLPSLPPSSRQLPPPPPPPPLPAPSPAPVSHQVTTPSVSNPSPAPVSMNMFDPSNFPPT